MRAASLLGVFLVAKVAVLEGRGWTGSGWAPLAFVWQDVAVAIGFAALDRALGRAWLGWAAYGLVVGFTALNVAVARILSTSLTWTMLRATRPELGDSILYYLTPPHLAWPALVLATGVMAPLALGRRRRTPRPAVLAAAAVVAVTLGPLASRRIDAGGLDRNPLVSLAVSARPRVLPRSASDPWRSSPFTAPQATGLGHLRGAAAGRNVVLVVLESAGAGHLGAYGGRPDPMPTVTSLATRAVLVENAYAVYPESVKGLFSILCSQYPALDTAPEAYARVRVPSVAQVLSGAGYHTGLFHSGRFMYLGMEAMVGGRGFEALEDAGAIGGQRDSSFGIDEASAVRRILGWIDGRPRDRPFLIVYLPIAGHHPYVTATPGPFLEERDVDHYHNALHEADAALEVLRRGLQERGLERSTLWAIVGDHGEAFGEHRGNFGHTLFVYEENVRVPFVIALPGILDATVRLAGPASLLDLAPTVLDLLGRPVPEGYEGRSLLAQSPGMALFYTDYSLGFLGLRDGCLKYVYALESGRSRVHDLCRDSAERRDLSAEFPHRVEFYRERLNRWAAAQKAQVEAAGVAAR